LFQVVHNNSADSPNQEEIEGGQAESRTAIDSLVISATVGSVSVLVSQHIWRLWLSKQPGSVGVIDIVFEEQFFPSLALAG
jgi:hypothetical protein